MGNFSTDEHVPPTSESIDKALGNENSSENVESNQQAEYQPRKIAGLAAGRIVNYVMKGGCLRPFLIVNPGDGQGVVSGVLFFDGFSDASNFPPDLGAPLVRDSFGRVLSALYVVGASFDDGGTLVGTWHWPTKQPVIASGIDPVAFNALLDARVAEIEAGLTEKLNKTVETVNTALDSNNELLKKLLTPACLTNGEKAIDSLASGLKEAAGEPEAVSGQQAESAAGGTTS